MVGPLGKPAWFSTRLMLIHSLTEPSRALGVDKRSEEANAVFDFGTSRKRPDFKDQ